MPSRPTYTVRVPALPRIVTQGESVEEAIAMGKEAISLYIESLVADGEPVPVETEHPQAVTVEVAAWRSRRSRKEASVAARNEKPSPSPSSLTE